VPKGTPGRCLCSVSGCDLPVAGRGMCGTHYRRMKTTGTTELRPRPTVGERFWSKVEKTDRCWLWTANRTTPQGYGSFALGHSKFVLAHRYAYAELVGPIPAGLTLDHLCRNPPCVNPAHLEPVTMRENTLRGTSPAARNAVKTHCLRGHPFDTVNTLINVRGERQCRACARDLSRLRKQLAMR